MKSIVKGFVLVLLLSIGLTALVSGLWVYLPWREYESVSKLCCFENREGHKRYGFEDNEKDIHLYETVVRMSEKWQSNQFRAEVGRALKPNGWDEKAKRCIDCAKIEVRSDKACVVVVTRSDDGEIAHVCAAGLANAIISTQIEEERRRSAQGVEQLKRNCDKQERYVALLAKKRNDAKTVAGNGEISALEKELARQQKTLIGMREALTRMKRENGFGLFFENIQSSSEDMFVVPPKLSLIFLLCASFVAMFVTVGCKLRRMKSNT